MSKYFNIYGELKKEYKIKLLSFLEIYSKMYDTLDKENAMDDVKYKNKSALKIRFPYIGDYLDGSSYGYKMLTLYSGVDTSSISYMMYNMWRRVIEGDIKAEPYREIKIKISKDDMLPFIKYKEVFIRGDVTPLLDTLDDMLEYYLTHTLEEIISSSPIVAPSKERLKGIKELQELKEQYTNNYTPYNLTMKIREVMDNHSDNSRIIRKRCCS